MIPPLILAYFGPETFLPIGSALAAVAGVLLMFGQKTLWVARGLIRSIHPGSKPAVAARRRPGELRRDGSRRDEVHAPETLDQGA